MPRRSNLALLSAVAVLAIACSDSGIRPTIASPESPLLFKGSGGGGSGGGGDDGGGAELPPVPPTVLTGPLYLRESFGFDPLGTGPGTAVRYDASGSLKQIALGKSINGFRAEYPNTASEMWMTPDPRHSDTWGFAASSTDPTEPFSTFELPGLENGTLASAVKPSDLTNNDALLNFLQPPGAVTASVTVYAGAYTVAVGFTPSGALTGNFETSGAAWLIVRMPRTNVLNSVSTWELHTNGVAGPSASGTFVASTFNRISVSYDPVAGTVSGIVDGLPTSALPYTVSGVKYVGFQGNGIVNDFRVEAGVK